MWTIVGVRSVLRLSSMSSERIDMPAAVGKVLDAVEPSELEVLGVVELELPSELLVPELLPEPGPEEESSSSPYPLEDSWSPDPEEVSSSPVLKSSDVLSSDVLSSEVLSSPSLVSLWSELLSSSSWDESEGSRESLVCKTHPRLSDEEPENSESSHSAFSAPVNSPAADAEKSKESVLSSASS